jgi:tetratricopeptide (TPR) repeat protein
MTNPGEWMMARRVEPWMGLAMMVAVALPAAASAPLVDAAAVALNGGNASNAVSLATQALADASLSPHDRAQILLDRGLAHEMLGERDAALIDFTEALDARALTKPEQARAYYDRGVTLDEMTRTDDALGDYAAAIKLLPDFAAALNNRANVYRRTGKLDAAQADYRASIQAGNAHPEYPNYGLGQVAEAAGNPQAARTYYQAAVTANPGFALARDRLAALGPGADAVIQLKPPGTIQLKPPPAIRRLPQVQPAYVQASVPPALKPALNDAGGATAAPPPPAGGLIQLGAWRSQAEAANAWSRIARASGSDLAGLAPVVVPVDLPGKGRFWRLRTDGGPELCRSLATKGLSCLVVRD